MLSFWPINTITVIKCVPIAVRHIVLLVKALLDVRNDLRKMRLVDVETEAQPNIRRFPSDGVNLDCHMPHPITREDQLMFS